MTEKEIRLNKYLSDAGICSRREADRLIEQGLVTVDGKTASTGQKVTSHSQVLVNNTPVSSANEKVYLLFNKPRGVECTSNPKVRNNIIHYLNYPIRITYAGRLDKNSEGLMLMTNDGDLINHIMRARNGHEKEYIVKVHKPITDHFINSMANGVPILGTITRPCIVEKIGICSFRIILTQGLNRQIRRMCEYFHYEVVTLKRIRILNLKLGDLPLGKFRPATPEEIRILYKQLEE